MAANKVVINGETKIDLTGDTVTAGNVAAGDTFHLASGAAAAGTMPGLDSVAFGAQPSPPGRGYTDGQYYEAIAEAINQRKAAGRGSEDVPTGQIIQMMGKTAPSGYLACDGGVYNISAYPALASYFAQQFEANNYWGGDGETTFGVPDLRGEFLRGAGTNAHANQGSGAEVGTHQDGTEIPVVRNLRFTNSLVQFRDSNDANVGPDNMDYQGNTGPGFGNIAFTASGQDGRDIVYSYTSRPTNTSVLYCIKT